MANSPILYRLALRELNADEATFGIPSAPTQRTDHHLSLTIRTDEWLQLGRPGEIEATVRPVLQEF